MRTLRILLYGLLPALSGGVALALLLDRAQLIEGGMVYALIWLPPLILFGGYFCHAVGSDPYLRGLYKGYGPRRLLIRLLLWLTNDVPSRRARLSLSLGSGPWPASVSSWVGKTKAELRLWRPCSLS